MTSVVEGIIGGGNTLKLTNSAGELQELQGIKTVTPPNLTASTVDTTDQKDGGVDDFLVSRLNPGEMAGTITYVPGNADDELLREHWASKQKRPAELSMPGDPSQTVAARVAVVAYSPNDAATSAERTASFTLKVSGLPTQGDN